MTCKDCYHYENCYLRIALNMDYDETKNKPITEIEKRCEYFKDKSLIVELPCKVGDNFFIIAQRFEKGEYTDFFIDKRQVTHFEYDGKTLMIYDFDEIGFVLDEIYFEELEAEAKLKELEK